MSETPEVDRSHGAFTRRAFLKGAGGVAAGGVVGAQVAAEAAQDGEPERLAGEIEIQLSINGSTQTITCEPRTTLLTALRDRCQPPLTGTKLVCDHGSCGACTVIVDGEPACACLMLAVDARGREVRTVEGLGEPGALSPVQEAFVEHDALMCGFCTPGFVMAITACLEKDASASLEDVKRSCAGNTCRCGTYPHIFDAAMTAGRNLRGGKR